MSKNFSGVSTAIITPFNKDGSVDFSTFEKLMERQISAGVTGVAVCGTTGEAPTLEHHEQIELIRRAVEIAGNRIKIIAGVGGNNTAKVVKLAKEVEFLGVDAFLIVLPYYNKPSQEGIVAHFKEIAEAVNIPIIVYNNPGRTMISISVDSLKKVSKFKNIIGIKDDANLLRMIDIRREIGPDFLQLSGTDSLNFEMYCFGGHGAISMASNAFPHETISIYSAMIGNNVRKALSLNEKFFDFYQACNYVNPVSIKYCMELLGLSSSQVRLPLVELDHERKLAMKHIISQLR